LQSLLAVALALAVILHPCQGHDIPAPSPSLRGTPPREMSAKNNTMQLTDKRCAEFKDLFSLFDKDGDKRISMTELVIEERSLGENLTAAEVQKNDA
jgi:hypothetical protein